MLSIMAIGGAFGGIVLGAEFGTAFPVTYGALGTMLGSALSAASGVYLMTSGRLTSPAEKSITTA